MNIDVAIAIMVGDVLGVFSTVILIGLAFAVRKHKAEKELKEDIEQHE